MGGITGRSGGARNRGNFDLSEQDGLPEKPTSMSEAQGEVWDELMDQLPLEALRKIDRHLLFLLSSLIAGSRKLNQEWLLDPADRDIRTSYMQTLEKIRQLSGLFGLSPADRKRIQIAEPKEEQDDLAEFM
jgi:hypothetical protein